MKILRLWRHLDPWGTRKFLRDKGGEGLPESNPGFQPSSQHQSFRSASWPTPFIEVIKQTLIFTVCSEETDIHSQNLSSEIMRQNSGAQVRRLHAPARL